jgi:hypothetical protein
MRRQTGVRGVEDKDVGRVYVVNRPGRASDVRGVYAGCGTGWSDNVG